MKIKLLYIALFVSVSYVTKAQSDSTLNSEKIIKPEFKKTKTLKISTVDVPSNILESLKDELSAWKEKVLNIELDEKNQEFIVIHNMLMDEKDLFNTLKNYNIKKEAIIYYK